jgi:hypothetical protein
MELHTATVRLWPIPLLEQGFGCTAVLLDTMRIGLECLFQRCLIGRRLLGTVPRM